jgi:hypothetical protein
MAKMTLEKLARMVAGGFKEVGERLNGVEKRLDRVEIEMRDLKEDVKNWRGIARDHENRIERLETKAGITN